jgi:head-tail adaptor
VINPGNLRTPLEVISRTETIDNYGQSNLSAGTAGSGFVVFAAVNEASAAEQMNHKQLNQVVTHRIRTRWHPSINHRSQFRTVATEAGTTSRRWEVVSVVDWQERRQFLDCMCREIVT